MFEISIKVKYSLKVLQQYDKNDVLHLYRKLSCTVMDSLSSVRSVLAACTWLKQEDVLPTLLLFPQKIMERGRTCVLPRLAAAVVFLLNDGMYIPRVFCMRMTQYRPFLGDDLFQAEVCMYLVYVMTAAYREFCHRSALTSETYFYLADEASNVRNQLDLEKSGYDLELKCEEDIEFVFQTFENQVFLFASENITL